MFVVIERQIDIPFVMLLLSYCLPGLQVSPAQAASEIMVNPSSKSTSYGSHHGPSTSVPPASSASYHHPENQGHSVGREIEDLTTLFGSGWWYNHTIDDSANRRRRRMIRDNEDMPPLYYRVLPTVLIAALLFSAGVIAGLRLLPISSSSPYTPILSSAKEEQQQQQQSSSIRGHKKHMTLLNQKEGEGEGGQGNRAAVGGMEAAIIMSETEEEEKESCIKNSAFPWIVSTCSCNSDLPVLDGK